VAFGRIYKAPCGKTHRVVRDKFPPTLDADLGRVKEGEGVEALSDTLAICKVCDRVKAVPCVGIAADAKLTAVTQYRCPGWVLTDD